MLRSLTMKGNMFRELEQLGVEEWFRSSHGTDRWTPLYQSAGWEETGTALFSCLLDPDSIADSLGSFGWDIQPGDGGPGFSQEYGNSETITRYHRSSELANEVIVLVRSFQGGRDSYFEISEELRLLFNLYEDRVTGKFFEIESDGREIEVIRTSSERVEIRTSFLRRYLAARQKALVLLIESDVWISHDQTNESLTLPQEREIRTDHCSLTFHTGKTSSKCFSRLLGKKILLPEDRTKMDLWPYERPEEFLDFIVGEDEDGRSIEHTCNPDLLGNYFGKNPNAPLYTSPTFFDPEVLRKYYENGDKYSVEDGIIRHKDLWLLRIDNNHPDHIMVFLGDLGRDIPQSERRHWRSYNLPTEDRSISETAFRRSFEGEFAAAESPEHLLKHNYVKCRETWQQAYAWPLFLPLHPQDRHVLSSLRLLLSATQDEFDSQVLDLAKLLVDSLNEADLVANTTAPTQRNDKGIVKIERFLAERAYPYLERDMTLLRTIQGLRSKGAAHRKGHDYNLVNAGLNPNDLKGSFVSLLNQATAMLADLATFANEKTAAPVDSHPQS